MHLLTFPLNNSLLATPKTVGTNFTVSYYTWSTTVPVVVVSVNRTVRSSTFVM